MKTRLQSRDRRALIFLGSAVAVYFLFTAVLFPVYDDLSAAEAAALEKEDQLLRYRRALVRSADYGTLLAEARRRVEEAEARLIPGDNPSLASAELQTIVEGAAQRTGIELGQRNMSPARPLDDYYNEITMALAFECTPGQLVQLLSEFRAVGKLVTVKSIQIAPVQPLDAAPVNGEVTKDLRVNVTLGAAIAPPSAGLEAPAPSEG